MPCLTNRFSAALISSLFSVLFTSGSSAIADEPAAWTANPELVKKLSAKRPFNYDEAKVPDYELPDPLRMTDGTKVSSASQWMTKRRPELLEQFRELVYGRRPDTAYQVSFETTETIEDAFDGLATGRSVKATVTIDQRTFSFPFVVFTPNRVAGKTPAVVAINNRYFIPLEKAVSEPDPFWPVKTMLERGYAAATFYTSHVDPDNKNGYDDGIRAFFADGKPPADDAWRSLSAWGWGASRVLDFLSTVSQIEINRVAVVGHSRGGKAAIWAAAEDERFAIAYSNNSGCGGAALSRRAYGETVARITSSFPHWFTPQFAEYADREDELPIDQHEAIALVAPRAVYVASSDEDLWADPRGEYASLVAAAPVFELVGIKSITEETMPPLNSQRIVGQTGYHIRSGGHGLGQVDWDFFIAFMDTVLK
ncbi:acetyl xylan esterase [Rhodopirellula maiorica SM1]|uniref:Acetyl xylan esterase n=1 Tax=Rhodopirellula maiorica SM1 TaxID=1265738 RepID=M5R7Y3_9BACT|nr:acetylxylan esterase [Rhodopirellula maiorica]EMI15593.1 acetyl xylan esterase [Rhodopirellula maiorica SM1]